MEIKIKDLEIEKQNIERKLSSINLMLQVFYPDYWKEQKLN